MKEEDLLTSSMEDMEECRQCKSKLEVVVKDGYPLYSDEEDDFRYSTPAGTSARDYTMFVCPKCLTFYEQYWLETDYKSEEWCEHFETMQVDEVIKRLSEYVEEDPHYINFIKLQKVCYKSDNKFTDYMRAIAYEIVYRDKPWVGPEDPW